jgi:hypothetical protein
MGAVCTGLALHRSGLLPFCGTFLVFSDYMRAAIRLAALSEVRERKKKLSSKATARIQSAMRETFCDGAGPRRGTPRR